MIASCTPRSHVPRAFRRKKFPVHQAGQAGQLGYRSVQDRESPGPGTWYMSHVLVSGYSAGCCGGRCRTVRQSEDSEPRSLRGVLVVVVRHGGTCLRPRSLKPSRLEGLAAASRGGHDAAQRLSAQRRSELRASGLAQRLRVRLVLLAASSNTVAYPQSLRLRPSAAGRASALSGSVIGDRGPSRT
jgi:hypothetical protein